MKVSLIAAVDQDWAIGWDHGLPWSLPEDLRRFKKLTINKPIIMGRKTFESIGRPLPKRKNIILTRDKTYKAKGCDIVHSVNAALHIAGDVSEVMVIGGSEVYEQFLPIASKIYLTKVHSRSFGNFYFPKLDNQKWTETDRKERTAKVRKKHPSPWYSFITLEKRVDRDLLTLSEVNNTDIAL